MSNSSMCCGVCSTVEPTIAPGTVVALAPDCGHEFCTTQCMSVHGFCPYSPFRRKPVIKHDEDMQDLHEFSVEFEFEYDNDLEAEADYNVHIKYERAKWIKAMQQQMDETIARETLRESLMRTELAYLNRMMWTASKQMWSTSKLSGPGPLDTGPKT